MDGTNFKQACQVDSWVWQRTLCYSWMNTPHSSCHSDQNICRRLPKFGGHVLLSWNKEKVYETWVHRTQVPGRDIIYIIRTKI